MLRILPALVLCAAIAGPAWAQTEVRLSPVTVEGKLQPPAPAPPLRYYPERAEQQHIEGDVTLRCQVKPPGRFDRCEIMDETPKGQEFGLHATEIVERLQFALPGADGKPLESGVAVIPLRFRMERPGAAH